MKKLISVLIIAIVIAAGCNNEPAPEVFTTTVGLDTPYALYPETLNGQVKQIVEKNFMASEEDGKYVKDMRLTVEARDTIAWSFDFKVLFDEAGNVLKSKYIDENDEVVDIKKNTIEESRIVKSDYIKDDTVRTSYFIAYSEDGLMEKITQMRIPEDTLIREILIEHNDDGQETYWKVISSEGTPTYVYEMKLDEAGTRVGLTVTNAEGEQTFEMTIEKNEKGFMKYQKNVNKKGETITEYEYEYDDMGNWIKAVAHSDFGLIIEEREITYYAEEAEE